MHWYHVEYFMVCHFIRFQFSVVLWKVRFVAGITSIYAKHLPESMFIATYFMIGAVWRCHCCCFLHRISNSCTGCICDWNNLSNKIQFNGGVAWDRVKQRLIWFSQLVKLCFEKKKNKIFTDATSLLMVVIVDSFHFLKAIDYICRLIELIEVPNECWGNVFLL